MRAQSLRGRIATLEARRVAPAGALVVADPLRRFAVAMASPPDPWQAQLLQSNAPRSILLTCRQAGKSTTTAALAIGAATGQARALVLLLAPSLRQSQELFAKVSDQYDALGRPIPVAASSALRLHLVNGSRIIALPANEATIRGYSGVTLLIVDEAARVADDLYYALRPMLAVSGGRLVLLSTPFGKRGFFHAEWDTGAGWDRYEVTALDCPRIPAAFLADERRAMGERWFRQEYLCSFEDAVGAVFSYEAISAALSDDVPPLFAPVGASALSDEVRPLLQEGVGL